MRKSDRRDSDLCKTMGGHYDTPTELIRIKLFRQNGLLHEDLRGRHKAGSAKRGGQLPRRRAASARACNSVWTANSPARQLDAQLSGSAKPVSGGKKKRRPEEKRKKVVSFSSPQKWTAKTVS